MWPKLQAVGPHWTASRRTHKKSRRAAVQEAHACSASRRPQGSSYIDTAIGQPLYSGWSALSIQSGKPSQHFERLHRPCSIAPWQRERETMYLFEFQGSPGGFLMCPSKGSPVGSNILSRATSISPSSLDFSTRPGGLKPCNKYTYIQPYCTDTTYGRGRLPHIESRARIDPKSSKAFLEKRKKQSFVIAQIQMSQLSIFQHHVS